MSNHVKGMTSCRPQEDDLISRQAVFDLLDDIDSIYLEDYDDTFKSYTDLVNALFDKNRLPSAQPEPCEDAVSREEAKWVVFCNRDHVEDQANAIDALPPVTPKAEQPDLSEYSDKLWKAAYERGKAEAQDEIVRCKECKYNSNTCGNYVNCDIIPQMFGRTVDNFCSRAERRTDDESI